MGKNSPKTEKDWEAEHDARTIADASAIKSDPTRLANAQRASMGMLKEKEAEVRGLRTLAKSKKPTKSKSRKA